MPDGHATYYTEDYEYPCESYINALLNTFLVRKTLQKVAERHYSEEVEQIYNESTLVNARNYPQLNTLYQKCIDKLHIANPVPLYVTSRLTGINALSIELRGKQMILLSRQAVARLADEEMLFVLGHELGHCQYGHMVRHTVLGLIRDMNNASEIIGPMVTDLVEVSLVQWFHCSEFTADRAGLICCQSMQTAYDIFLQLGMTEDEKDVYTEYRELSSPHPLLRTRWEMLQKYANTVR